MADDIALYLSKTYGTRAFDLMEGDKKYSSGLKRLPSLSRPFTTHLERLYPNHPYTVAEVHYVIKNENARTAADVLCRRTRLAFTNIQAAHFCVNKVCDILKEELGWSDEKTVMEVLLTRDILDKEFAGPVADKACAKLRKSTEVDLERVWSEHSLTSNTKLEPEDVDNLSKSLGYKLTREEILQAVDDVGSHDDNNSLEKAFRDWWNSDSNNPNLRRLGNMSYAQNAFDNVILSTGSVSSEDSLLTTIDQKKRAIAILALNTQHLELDNEELTDMVSHLDCSVKNVEKNVSKKDFVNWATSAAIRTKDGAEDYSTRSHPLIRMATENFSDRHFGQK